MILDSENLFSDNQSVKTSAASANVIDLGNAGRNLGFGNKVPLLVQITETFVGVNALTIAIQTSDDVKFQNMSELASQTIAGTELQAGTRFSLSYLPYGQYKRYLRLNYVVDGAGTAGKVTAGITAGNDETVPYV